MQGDHQFRCPCTCDHGSHIGNVRDKHVGQEAYIQQLSILKDLAFNVSERATIQTMSIEVSRLLL